MRPANPEFYVLLEQLSRIQNSGDIGVRVSPKGDMLTLVFRRSHSAAVRQAVRNVTTILGVDPETKEFNIVFGAVPANNKEIAMVTRSIFEVLLDIASTIAGAGDARDGTQGFVDAGGRPQPAWNDSAPHQDHELVPAARRLLRDHPL